MSQSQLKRVGYALTLMLVGVVPVRAQTPEPPRKGVPLPRCVLYNSYRLTPQGMMQCSYQCGDRIIMRSGYQTCAGSWARPRDGEQ